MRIYLYFKEIEEENNIGHFSVITKINGFLATRNFCEKCLKSYTVQHTCKDTFLDANNSLLEQSSNTSNQNSIEFIGATKGCKNCLDKKEHKCSFWYCTTCKIIYNNHYVKKDAPELEQSSKKHLCGEYKCYTCGKLVLPIDGKRDKNHKCYIQRNEKHKALNVKKFFMILKQIKKQVFMM